MRLLAVETSTPESSVALAGEEGVIRCESLPPGRTQTELLMGAIDRLLRACQTSVRELDGFAVAVGPGAFIGVRVGIATIKGLAMATGKRVMGISTLEGLAARALELPIPADQRLMICPMIDARRREVYAARYRPDDGASHDRCLMRDGDELLVRPEELLSQLTGPTCFLGDGAQLHRALILERLGADAWFPPAERPEWMAPSAAAVARLALRRWREGEAVDPADLTAVYLRPAAMPPPAPEVTRA